MIHDVIIVGAGPVGLFLACELKLAGIEPLVLEGLERPTGLSKALGMPGRAEDYLDHRGLLQRFRERSIPGAENLARFVHFGMVPLDVSKASVRKGLFITQAATEALLNEHAAELGIDIRRGHDVVGFVENEHGVSVDVRTGSGRQLLEARFIVGCDGGGSAVRRQAGIEFKGLGPTSLLRLGDVKVAPASENLPFLMPLGDGYWRLITREAYDPDLDRSAPMTLTELAESAERAHGRPVELLEARWLSRFTDASRQAGRYWRGRVALAGDAAHVFLPAGGPGLLTGIGDAMNLGWKLAAYLKGEVGEDALESYHTERHAVGARVVAFARAQGMMMMRGEREEGLRQVFRDLVEDAAVIDRLLQLTWQLDVRYDGEDSTELAGRFVPDLGMVTAEGPRRIADLMHEGGWHWVEFGEVPALRELLDPLGERVRRIVAAPGREIAAEALLIRPDGHVAWAAGPSMANSRAALRKTLTRWFPPALLAA